MKPRQTAPTPLHRFAAEHGITWDQGAMLIQLARSAKRIMEGHATDGQPDTAERSTAARKQVREYARELGFDGAVWYGLWPTIKKQGRDVELPTGWR